MAKKYDTNPLDENILNRAENEFSERAKNISVETRHHRSAQPTAFFEAETRNLVSAPTVEQLDQTQTSDFNPAEPYQSVLQNPMAHAPVSQAVQYHIERPTSRKITGLGIPEKVAMILPYLPFTLGAIAAIVELLLVARTETRVRFHAAQGLALHIVWLLIGVVLAFADQITDFAGIVKGIFHIVVTVYFVISIVRVWQGKPNHIEPLDDLTDFLNEKLKPKN